MLSRLLKASSSIASSKGLRVLPLSRVNLPKKSLFNMPSRSFFRRKEKIDITTMPVDQIPVHELLASNSKWEMVYEGFLYAGIRRLKIFSFSSMIISLVSVPVILTFETDSIPMSGKIVLAAVTFMIGVSTTVIINYFTKAYVMRMFVNRANPNIIEAITLSLTGKLRSTQMLATDAFTAVDGVKYMCSFKHIPSNMSFFIHDVMATHPVFSVMMPHLFEDAQEHDDAAVVPEEEAHVLTTPEKIEDPTKPVKVKAIQMEN